MSEHTERAPSRLRHFLLMLPFFLIGIALPVYFYGFSGDGPIQATPAQDTFSPASPGEPGEFAPPSARRFDGPSRFGIVAMVRDAFDGIVNTYVSPDVSPLVIKLGTIAALFVGGFVVLRVVIAIISGTLGSVIGFLIHKAAAPMFMGFLAVGSTWGIHQTVAEQFGLSWAATSVTITAAIATLFALAGVRVRA
jgi:hypothetical protein